MPVRLRVRNDDKYLVIERCSNLLTRSLGVSRRDALGTAFLPKN